MLVTVFIEGALVYGGWRSRRITPTGISASAGGERQLLVALLPAA